MRRDIAIIGAGFAGSLLARLLALRGRDVLLLERDRHPRFSLGESSTPLAALALERLARRYQQPDLHSLAAHGRWCRDLSGLRCGLKRGFTFYRHRPDSFAVTADARLLVAASPDDEVADCQWLRADVDAHLVARAREAGVDYRDRFEIVSVQECGDGMRLHGREADQAVDIDAGFVVDASGAGEVLARTLGVESTEAEFGFASRLLYAHFDGVPPFAEVLAEADFDLTPGPYPDDWAAVHHLLDEGWMYVLRFDDGLVSAGVLIDESQPGPAAGDADARWQVLMSRYPALASTFASANPVAPGIRATGRLQRWRRRAAGARWAMLPQTFAFFDPLFSTGIAWNLLGVERLAGLLEEGWPSRNQVNQYAALLQAEASQQRALLEAAYLARHDFSVFRDLSFLYFACVSFEEIRQRLLGDVGTPAAWRGFLGARDPFWTTLFLQAPGRVRSAMVGGETAAKDSFSTWLARAIRPRNLVGLGESPAQLYGIEPDVLIARSGLLGITRDEMRALLPRLRGGN